MRLFLLHEMTKRAATIGFEFRFPWRLYRYQRLRKQRRQLLHLLLESRKQIFPTRVVKLSQSLRRALFDLNTVCLLLSNKYRNLLFDVSWFLEAFALGRAETEV